jgi:hypothetical protein
VLLVILAVLAMPVLSKPWLEIPEMKVKVHATPDQVRPFARQVLEFYEATPEWFIGAVQKPVYEELLAKGFRIEVLVPDVRARALELDAYFHSYTYFRDTWGIIAAAHPDICVFDTIGRSAGGRRLVAMKISDNPTQMEGEPRICFDFSIHGNENNGCEIADYAMKQLLDGYGVDPFITYLVNEREIWLIPMDNPDGLVSRSRYNDNGIDMNRDYGYAFDEGAGGGSTPFQETEVQSFYHLAERYPMAAWSQYHSGATMAMQPWGYTSKATMDSVIHAWEMGRYGQITGYQAGQISRILYPVDGGSTDWYYGARGALGYAIEVCDGQPSPVNQIDTINRANWTAMREQIQRVGRGISGYVTDSMSGQPVAARISVNPPDWFTYTDSIGYYHKNAWAGTYAVTATANGYATKTVSGVVVPADTFVLVNVALARDTAAPTSAFKLTSCKIAQSTPNVNPTNGWWALGRQDGRRFSLGNGGYATFDMGASTPILNGAGDDFTVIEGDADPEACSVFVSNTWLGPWHYVGFGTGTQGYDLSAAGQSLARFVRIRDDGNGGSGANAGFDLDALEAVVVNAPAVVYQSQAVLDSAPGNNDGKLDPGETAGLAVSLKNAGRVGVTGLTAVLRTSDVFVSVLDSTADYGAMPPDTTRTNWSDLFQVAAASGTPREHPATMKLFVTGVDYADSITFTIVVGEIRSVDPIPDGPRTPARYWAYDDVDVGYPQHPAFGWVEINPVGTRLTLSDDQTTVVSLPTGFGPWRYYGQSYTQISICSNGWVAPGSTTNSAYTNATLPDGQSPPNISLLWDDLYPGTGNGVWYYHDAANHRFVVEYDSVAKYSPRSSFITGQVVIYDTTMSSPTGDNILVMQYKAGNDFGSSTIGIEDPAAAIGIQCLYNGAYTRGCADLAAGRAIKYTTQDPTGIRASDDLPLAPRGALALGANPLRREASIRYDVPAAGRVVLSVYDNSGRLVRELAQGRVPAGRYHATWNRTDGSGRTVAAGVYWLRLETAAGENVVKAVVVR